jgi:hypothetical protein
LQPGKPYPNTTEAGFMKVNDSAGSQRVAKGLRQNKSFI